MNVLVWLKRDLRLTDHPALTLAAGMGRVLPVYVVEPEYWQLIDATDVAGVLVFNPIEGQSGVWEYGTFNLPRCDLAGASPICLPR